MTSRNALERVFIITAQIVAVGAFLICWQMASEHHVIDPVYFSEPTAIWDQLRTWYNTGVLWQNTRATLYVFLVGYVVGTGLGIILGIVIGTLGWFRDVTSPFVAFFNATPRLVLLPLFIVWFGFGFLAKIILVISVIVLMVALNVAAGLREVRVDVLNNARLMGAGSGQLVRHVYWPSVALWVTSTARVTVGYAFNAAIAAEFIGANTGLGYLIVVGQTQFQVTQIYAALAITVIIAIAADLLLAAIENRATRWMPAR